MTTKAPFVINPELTGIAIAYRNRRMIADLVLPRVPVGKQDYSYTTYNKADAFTVPNTLVGRRGQTTRVEFGGTETTSSCKPYGLEDGIPIADISNAPKNLDPKKRAAEVLTNLIELDREIRTANLVFNAANFAASNKATLAGSDQWSHVDSKPVKLINAALDVPLMRPNVLVLGQAVWTQLKSNPDIVKATNRNSGDSGNASRQAVAELFELEEILVGEGFVNTARPGQAAVFSRVWGKSAALIYRDKMADTRGGVTFGWSAQFKDRIAMEREDSDIGLEGGIVVRTGEYIDERLVAPDVGYLFSAAVA